MRILFLDTETNGLPQNRYAPYTMSAVWPALVQIAWQVLDFPYNQPPQLLYQSSFLMQPEKDQTWNTESEAIHGISEVRARVAGLPIINVLRTLISDASECDIIVAHNLAFDKSVLLAATVRTGLNPRWWPAQELCTMMATKDICKIPSKWAKPTDPYKWPKLSEVWQMLFPTSALPEDMHNAAQDVAVLVTCFKELVQRNLLVLPAIPTKGLRRSERLREQRRSRFTDLVRSVLATLVP